MQPAKIVLFTLIALVVLVGVVLGANLLVLGLGLLLKGLLGVDPFAAVGGWAGSLLLLAVLYLMPKGWLAWNRKYECHGSTVIDAPISEVWDWLQIRERDEYFTSSIERISEVPGTDDEFNMHFEDKLSDPDDGMPDRVHVRIVDEVPEEYLAYYIVNIDDMPLFGKDHLMTEILLTQEKEGVKVTYIETLSRLTLGSFLAFLFLNPAKDAMTSLKAQMEGVENPSILHRWTKNTGDNGEPPAEITRAMWISGTTAVIASTAMVAALLYVVTRMVTS